MYRNRETGLAFRDDAADDELNADLSRPACTAPERVPWQASPEPGGGRKRLELMASGLPRLTTRVRFAPGSRFAEHGHDAGDPAQPRKPGAAVASSSAARFRTGRC